MVLESKAFQKYVFELLAYTAFLSICVVRLKSCAFSSSSAFFQKFISGRVTIVLHAFVNVLKIDSHYLVSASSSLSMLTESISNMFSKQKLSICVWAVS